MRALFWDNDDDDPGPPPKGGDRLSVRSDGERHADKTHVNLVRGKPGSTPDPRPSLYGRAYAYGQQESDEEIVFDEATIQKQKEFDIIEKRFVNVWNELESKFRKDMLELDK